MNDSRGARLSRLFVSMLSLATFTFGGGFVIVSLMKRRFVEEMHLLDEDEMLDIAAIAQSCPGPIMVNAAVLVGYRVAGVPGALVSALASALPPLVIISIIAVFYAQFRENRYVAIALQVMRAGVAAVIFDVVVDLCRGVLKTRRALYILMMAAAFVASVLFDVPATTIILLCLCVGACQAAAMLLRARKGGRHAL